MDIWKGCVVMHETEEWIDELQKSGINEFIMN